jgi:hypothetical protein
MVDSKEFAVGVFDALARRRRLNLERISKDELHDFWLQISDQSFDARLQIFFDMYVRSCLLSNPCRCVMRFLLHVISGSTPTWTGGSRGRKCRRLVVPP